MQETLHLRSAARSIIAASASQRKSRGTCAQHVASRSLQGMRVGPRLPRNRGAISTCQFLAIGAPGRARTCDPRLRRPDVQASRFPPGGNGYYRRRPAWRQADDQDARACKQAATNRVAPLPLLSESALPLDVPVACSPPVNEYDGVAVFISHSSRSGH